jgi:hypothetical protein
LTCMAKRREREREKRDMKRDIWVQEHVCSKRSDNYDSMTV